MTYIGRWVLTRRGVVCRVWYRRTDVDSGATQLVQLTYKQVCNAAVLPESHALCIRQDCLAVPNMLDCTVCLTNLATTAVAPSIYM